MLKIKHIHTRTHAHTHTHTHTYQHFKSTSKKCMSDLKNTSQHCHLCLQILNIRKLVRLGKKYSCLTEFYINYVKKVVMLVLQKTNQKKPQPISHNCILHLKVMDVRAVACLSRNTSVLMENTNPQSLVMSLVHQAGLEKLYTLALRVLHNRPTRIIDQNDEHNGSFTACSPQQSAKT